MRALLLTRDGRRTHDDVPDDAVSVMRLLPPIFAAAGEPATATAVTFRRARRSGGIRGPMGEPVFVEVVRQCLRADVKETA